MNILPLCDGRNISPACQTFPEVLRKGNCAAWQYSRKLITQERIYEKLLRLMLFTCFGKVSFLLRVMLKPLCLHTCWVPQVEHITHHCFQVFLQMPSYLSRLSSIVTFPRQLFVTLLCKIGQSVVTQIIQNHGIVSSPIHLLFNYLSSPSNQPTLPQPQRPMMSLRVCVCFQFLQ